MLVLTRRRGEGVTIGPDIRIVVLQTKGGQVKLGIEAPPAAASVRRGLGIEAMKSRVAEMNGAIAWDRGTLGGTRVTDLAVNVVLPWLWTRAAAGRNSALQREIERRYFAWPAAEDNSVLRLARQRLLAGAGRDAFRTAAAQQGLMQIVRDFCNHSNAVCDDCPFPELVRDWSAGS